MAGPCLYRENNSGELHRETAEQKANRIISEELSRRGWAESALATRRRSGPGKVAIAARLRKEVRNVVWRRAKGMCEKCGSVDNLEFDHIIPVSKGGSNKQDGYYGMNHVRNLHG